MARPKYTRPTDAELEILNVLWREGPSTVLQVRRHLANSWIKDSSVLKLMQIMVDRGLLKRDESVRPQIYRPALKQDQVQRNLVQDLMNRVFAGSPTQMVMQLLGGKKVSPKEREQVQQVLASVERK